MSSPEWIRDGDEVLALVVRNDYVPAATEFLTPADFKQQLGFIVYDAGGLIYAHDHKPLQRTLVGTSEVLLVKKGRVEAYFYSTKRTLVCKLLLGEGDVLLLVAGGHGFRMLEDSILLEIKQGPYTGMEEKERFSERLE